MKILIVDDSKAMRMILLRTLRQAGFEGHTVVEASNGTQALELVRASPPDLVLADWNMPGMGGLELLRTLRTGGFSRTFGFVTSEGTDDIRQQAIEAGAAFLIQKPFTVDAFRVALAKHVS